ncbi:hypothetical protein Vadar_013087 [Vaccinium darrowii]|uniref:Uncharacterized protein n=1 Tax=Vaccinium darrowii TaxID=229202 RepID=A0ACB7XR65_9ERIC|nr:hypothetical protein Vadar_013087 [Vaccinium darrowii]
MLEIPNMTDEELLFNFMDNLQPCAEQELRRRGIQDLATAMAVAESLIEYKKSDKANTSKGNPGKGGGEKHKGPECPKRQALSALIQEKETEEAHVGSHQLLNAIKSKPIDKIHGDQGLMFVEMCVNGKPTRALVDIGATHNFVSVEEAKRLGLKPTKEAGWLKAVNSEAKPLLGVARGVDIRIGSWDGKIDLTVAPMDDFQVVVGMDFLSKVKAVPLPYLRSMAILEEKTPCMVKAMSNSGFKTPLLSAMQVKKGFKKGEATYLAALANPKEDATLGNLPKEIEGRSESTNHSPFKLATGQQPLTPHTVATSYMGMSPAAFKFVKGWHEQADVASSYLEKASKKMKKWADKKRRNLEYQVGDLVLVKLLPQQFKSLRKVHKGLVRKCECSFPIVKRVRKVSFQVQLPPKLKIHPVFHVSHLKPYHGDTDDPSRGESSRAPTAVITSYDKEVEYILADRIIR